jgi:hypothetical protein
LWAYHKTYGGEISKRPGSPVALAALQIGRVVSGVYNKVMNFRHLDPRDERKGFSGGSDVDKGVWNEFFDPSSGQFKSRSLEDEYRRLWSGNSSSAPPGAQTTTAGPAPTRLQYADFGEAPNDDPAQIQHFARKVRKGQPRFRRNLLDAYEAKCAISGWGPEAVLEAAHILSHSDTGLNSLENGLLLRSDLHGLFDDGLLKIDPNSFKVLIDGSLKATEYWQYNGQTLRGRQDGSHPVESLRKRWNA